MKTRMNETGRQAYCRPATWTVPCELAPMMGPSLHAVGNHWTDVGEFGSSLDWGSGPHQFRLMPPSSSNRCGMPRRKNFTTEKLSPLVSIKREKQRLQDKFCESEK